jgi:hypothetical protein
MSKLSGSDRWIIVIPAFLFWLLVTFPFWLLGVGLAGEITLWPSFEPDVWLLSLLFVIAFYGPLLLIGLVVVDAIGSLLRNSESSNKNA